MIALWMAYATIIGGLLAAAALALEHLAAMRAWPRRWVWLAAVCALPILPLLAPEWNPELSLTLAPSHVSGVVLTESTSNAVVSSGGAGTIEPSQSFLGNVGSAITTAWNAQRAAIATMAWWFGRGLARLARFDHWLLIGWAAASALLLASYVFALARLANQRRRWPTARIDGDTVLVAPDAGPAVVGAFQPMIVLPAWSLTIDPSLRALILRHEREHLHARDPLLLHVVTLAAYLVPWNLPVWWMLRRVRLAIEVDCDRRVLRAGGDAQRYADLLLTVGSRRSGALRVLAPALAEGNSQLARRIVAMFPGRGWSQFRFLRVAGCAGGAYLLIAAASAIPAPESPRKASRLTPATRALGSVTGQMLLSDSSAVQLLSSPTVQPPSPTKPTARQPVRLPTLVARASAPKRPSPASVSVQLDSIGIDLSFDSQLVMQKLFETMARSARISARITDTIAVEAIELRPASPRDSSARAPKRVGLIMPTLQQANLVSMVRHVPSWRVRLHGANPIVVRPGDSSYMIVKEAATGGYKLAPGVASMSLQVVFDSTRTTTRNPDSANPRVIDDSTKNHLIP